MRSPILAAMLSLILSGLGQIYNGQVTKGVPLIAAQMVNAALTAILIGWVLMPIVSTWTLVEKYETA
jgi:TM2 domain-containing membrane protein YozV